MAKNVNGEAIGKLLAGYNYAPPPATRRRKPRISHWEPPELVALLSTDSNAILFAAIADYQVPFQQAWNLPVQLKARLGHLDLKKIAKMTPDALEAVLAGPPSLHRFNSQVAQRIILASKKLLDEYDGDAANVWSDRPGAQELLQRVGEFKGIGDKIARMLVRLLATYFGVPVKGLHELDIPVDRHIARVFLRTGLVAGKPRTTSYRAAEVADEVTLRARELSPEFPALLDQGAFDVGLSWCREQEALCEGDGQAFRPCPLSKACGQNRRHWSVTD